MQKLLLSFLLAFASVAGFAQKDTADNYVNRFISIPAFNINIVPDSSFFSKEQLNKNAPFIIKFFSPDCDHCQKQVKDLLAYKDELKNVQVLMVSPLSFKDNNNFYKEYNLSSMTNIKLGFDPTYKLRKLYNTQTYPSMYVYDKRGTLAKAFVGNIGVQAILDAVK